MSHGSASYTPGDPGENLFATNPEAWLAAIVESSDDAVVGKTLDSIIRSWNAGATRVFGYSAAEAIGQPVYLIIPRERYDEEPRIIEQLMRGERIDHFETVRLRKDGTEIEVSISVSPIRDESVVSLAQPKSLGTSPKQNDCSGWSASARRRFRSSRLSSRRR